MSTFLHNGVTITLTPGGKFRTTVNGKQVDKPSLDAAKAAIDKAGVFTPIKGFAQDGYNANRTREFLVTGTRKAPGKYARPEQVWVIDDNQGNTRGVFWPDTPENRAAFNDLCALKDKNDALRDNMKAAEEAARAKLVSLTVKQFLEGKQS
jgi:hypothetical protein